MKLVDMFGKPQSYPFVLGERGRGRYAEEVRVDGRRPPTGESVGFATFTVGGHTHAVITCDTRQAGILVRLDTKWAYARQSYGVIARVCGPADKLASGSYAYGDAGGIGGGPDELWHVRGPTLFRVYLSGGERKGGGARYVLADARRVTCFRADALAQIIATDDDPWVANVLRSLDGQLPEDLTEAVAAGAHLEAAVEAAAHAPSVPHYIWYGTVANAAATAKLAIPVGHTGGFDTPRAGALAPGSKSLVSIIIGPGGGKRYSYEILEISGLEVLHQEPERTSGNHCSIERLVALAAGDFLVRWREAKDGEWTETFSATRESCRGLPWTDAS
jgi:hypothetical protein